jgi:hypothetical protein
MRRWLPPLAPACWALACWQVCFAAEIGVQQPDESLEEVQITATSSKLTEMRVELEKAEDRFYDKYNELNEEREFDIHCNMEKRTGTNLSARVCRPQFVADATADEAMAYLTGRAIQPSAMIINVRYPEFEKKMLAVINSSPELRKLIKEHDRLEKRYEKLRKEYFKRRKQKK